jgi:rhodanese-related sulfurtransferase
MLWVRIILVTILVNIVLGAKMSHAILEIDSHTAKMWLDKGEAILVDVREPGEYADARIANSTLIPLGTVSADKLPKLQAGQKLIVHCARGARSARAIEKLKSEQPELPLYNLAGGITDWIQLGLPVLKGK